MTKTGKWLLGCGAGCAAVVILVGVIFIGGTAWLVREATEPMERAVETRKALTERLGEIDAYTPPPEWVRADRLEAFLRVRDRTTDSRERIEASFLGIMMTPQHAREIEDKGFLEGMRTAWKMSKSGFALGPGMARFFEARNEALLAEEVGLGEYTWLYALSYWSYLGEDPSASVTDAEKFKDLPADQRPIGFDGIGFMSMSRVRSDLRGMFHRAAAAHPDDVAAVSELEQLEANPDRLPWQDGLPDEIATVFEPYRDRLEATWSAASNSFELSINRKTGRMSYQIE